MNKNNEERKGRTKVGQKDKEEETGDAKETRK